MIVDWDVYMDMVVCSHVMECDINDKLVIKDLCKRFGKFGVTPSKLIARANNFEHIVHGKASFWKTCKSQREAYRILEKYNMRML